MIRVGVAGIGFIGWIHWLAYRATDGIEVRAICELDEKRLRGDWRDIKGNFGPPGEQVDLTGIACYKDLDQLVADPSLELIDICLPPHLHADVAIRALQAGKHVFCEKPLALTAEDCERVVAAARQAGRQLLVGHVLPLFPEYARARQLIDSGQYGKLLGGYFKRVISDPTWLADFYDPQRVGGPLLDLHIHDAHFIRLLFGMPKSLVSRGRMRGEVVQYCNTLFDFDDPSLVVSASSGVIDQQGREFTQGFEIHLQRATLQYEFAVVGGQGQVLMPLTLYNDQGAVERPDVGDGDPVRAFEAEVAEVRRAVEQNKPSPLLGGELARDAVILCHKQTESVTSRQAVHV